MKDKREFTESQVTGGWRDDHPKFEADATFLSVVPTDESGGDGDEIEDLISSFRRCGDMHRLDESGGFLYRPAPTWKG